MAEKYDYVIVGAGTAGCVLANRLTACGKYTVCLLEAGPPDWNPMIHIPAGFMKTIANPSVNWLYQSEPCPGTNGRTIPMPRGKVIGGSSSINGLIFSRGQKMDFDVWAQKGNRGWSYDDVLPYFRRYESHENSVDNTFRGQSGEMTITDLKWRDPLCEAFIKGAESIGIPRNPDYNGAYQEGTSYVQRTSTGKLRMSAARAFLKPARKRQNLRVITNAHATKILLDGKRATGVAYKRGGVSGRSDEVHASLEVIIAGGAINSPQLLQISGIGPANMLNDLGIEVVHDLAGVGENLRDHYGARLTARAKNVDTINELAHGPKLFGEIVKYFLGRRSILELGPTLVYCFWHSDEMIRNADLQISFTPASYNEGKQAKLDKEPGFSLAAWQQRPESLGYVRVRNKNPFEKPQIQPNYLSHEEDRRVLLAGIKVSRRLMNTEALAPYFDYEGYPGAHVQKDDELLDVARQRSTTLYHLMGTCRMATETDPTAVVDDQLRIHGLQNIRVIDASIMPSMPSANLNAAVMMIAEKGADMILRKPPL
ncbi:GMC family oxidoreductase N-terminal domain-containing protein [Candidatus Puniceispirillum sp.]|nr:GMC family oxidoreductase N-terminal domain-containing protein [Candidatus Puniceispirillum sp.]